jgi:hypothetical protein
MMGIGGAVLSILQLAPYFAEADSIISATKDTVELVGDLKTAFESTEGQKIKRDLMKLIGSATKAADGVHFDIAQAPRDPAQPRPGHWEWDNSQWDALQGPKAVWKED